jgi:hypothetical protein
MADTFPEVLEEFEEWLEQYCEYPFENMMWITGIWLMMMELYFRCPLLNNAIQTALGMSEILFSGR